MGEVWYVFFGDMLGGMVVVDVVYIEDKVVELIVDL